MHPTCDAITKSTNGAGTTSAIRSFYSCVSSASLPITRKGREPAMPYQTLYTVDPKVSIECFPTQLLYMFSFLFT